MKHSEYENERDELNGVNLNAVNEFLASNLDYPKSRALITTIHDKVQLLIEVHVLELGAYSPLFMCTANIGNTDILDVDVLLGPMVHELNARIDSALSVGESK